MRVCVEEKRQIGHVAHRDCRRQRRRGKDGVTRVPSTEEKWVIGHEAWDGSFSNPRGLAYTCPLFRVANSKTVLLRAALERA